MLLLLAYFGHRVAPGLPSVPERGGYKGRTGLSPPGAYPLNMEYEANEGSL